jgi:hypothetical protein
MNSLFDVTFPAGRRSDIIARNPLVLTDINGIYSPRPESSLLIVYSFLHDEWIRWYFGWNDHYKSKEVLDAVNDINREIIQGVMQTIPIYSSLKKRRIWILLESLEENTSGITRDRPDSHYEAIPPIPGELDGLFGPANRANSCYCDSYLVCMFMATDAFDTILWNVVEPKDFYAFRSDPFRQSPFVDISGESNTKNVDARSDAYANEMRRSLLSVITAMRRVNSTSAIVDKSRFVADRVELFLASMRYFGFSSNAVGVQQDIPELHAALTDALGSYYRWSVAVRGIRTIRYYLLPRSEFKRNVDGLYNRPSVISIVTRHKRDSSMTSIQLIPDDTLYGKTVTLSELFRYQNKKHFERNTPIIPSERSDEEIQAIRDIEDIASMGRDALTLRDEVEKRFWCSLWRLQVNSLRDRVRKSTSNISLCSSEIHL